MNTTLTRIFWAGVFGCLAASVSLTAQTAAPPNIILLLADDLGYGELGCYGNRQAHTPNLDAMAQAGARFTSAYVTCPVCSPTRAGLLTGKYQQRFGHENNIGQSWELEHGELMGLPLTEKTIADRLQAAGYRTAAMGKWHLGAHEKFHPQARGFDEFFGFLEGGRAYLSDDDPGNYYLKPVPPFAQVHFKQLGKAPIYRGRAVVEEKEYLTDAFAREALRFIDANKDRPFFLYLAFNAVHTPITPCARWESQLAQIQNPVRRTLASMTAAMDENIGKLREHLRRCGLEQKTLVIFLSDNGGSHGGTAKETNAVSFSLNTPLRGFKGECYEGGIRIPYLLEWPGKIKPGTTCDAAVSSLDVLPTALAAAGAPAAELTDGVNLLPFLEGSRPGSPHEELFWRFHIYKAVRKGNLKLVKVRDQADQLFDLGEDLQETKNLAAEKPAVVAALNQDLAAWEAQMIPPRWNQQFPLRPDGRPLFPRNAAPEKGPKAPAVSLRENLLPTPLRDVAAGTVEIKGKAAVEGEPVIRVRVTTSLGATFETKTKAHAGQFACRFPQDFPGAPPLTPLLLYVDATDAPEFGGKPALDHQAEALLIVTGQKRAAWPDLPLVFTDDFTDAQGRKDAECAQWERNRALTSLFYHSRAARLMNMQRPAFDLARRGDFNLFKESATLYDFDHRDRDWSQPLGHRVAPGFWQAVWNTWFNASNDHPWDGNAANRTPGNFRPYTFANDPADLIVMYQLRPNSAAASDNRARLVNDVLANLLALQQRGPDNFALKEASGKQEFYTAGAFHYGMFETGEWLTEGKGWFANPAFRDFVRGGVFNGRCLWAIGESLKAEPRGPWASQAKSAIELTLRFCLQDGLAHKYTWLTKSGRKVWCPVPGEHGYLVLGMLAAAEATPDLPIKLTPDAPAKPLRALCLDALDALAEIALPDGTWSRYANVDAVNLSALAEGARIFPLEPSASRWKSAAARAADVWLALKPLPAERTTPTPMFGHRKDAGMTFYLGKEEQPHLALYVSGLWLQTLACTYGVTHDERYAQRAHAILAYYCGDNPLHVRVLNELGCVNNRITDTDKDGVEDQFHWNAYPESTAFVQIGLLKFLEARSNK